MEHIRIPTVWLPVTYRCNNRCGWCYAQNELDKARDLSDQNRELFLDFFSYLSVKKIVLIGGEPTIYPNITRLIEDATNRDIRVGMVSNGRKLADYYNFCKNLKEAGIQSTTISIQGSTAEIHDKITKVSGSFDQSLRGIENLILTGIDASTETVMSRDNGEDLENIVDLTEQYDLKQSAYSICGPCLTERNSEFSLSLNEGAKMFERAFVHSKYKERMKLITSSTICSFDPGIYAEMKKHKAVSGGCHILTGSRFVLEPNGDVLPCVHFAGLPIMNIFEEGKIMSAEGFLEKYNSPEGKNQTFRKMLGQYPSTKCRDDGCWGNECSGGCPIFWSQYSPQQEIKGLEVQVK